MAANPFETPANAENSGGNSGGNASRQRRADERIRKSQKGIPRFLALRKTAETGAIENIRKFLAQRKTIEKAAAREDFRKFIAEREKRTEKMPEDKGGE